MAVAITVGRWPPGCGGRCLFALSTEHMCDNGKGFTAHMFGMSSRWVAVGARREGCPVMTPPGFPVAKRKTPPASHPRKFSVFRWFHMAARADHSPGPSARASFTMASTVSMFALYTVSVSLSCRSFMCLLMLLRDTHVLHSGQGTIPSTA